MKNHTHLHTHKETYQVHSYALKRMSLALQRIIHAPTNNQRSQALKWFRAWSILDKKLQSLKG